MRAAALIEQLRRFLRRQAVMVPLLRRAAAAALMLDLRNNMVAHHCADGGLLGLDSVAAAAEGTIHSLRMTTASRERVAAPAISCECISV